LPRYFFEIINRDGIVKDDEGQELTDLGAARRCAVAAVRSIISDESRRGHVDLRGRIRVTQRGGGTVLVLPYSEAVEVRTGPPPLAEDGAGILYD
jgi:uncharacterized protein with von Willebrand factor type A (vWA) domain